MKATPATRPTRVMTAEMIRSTNPPRVSTTANVVFIAIRRPRTTFDDAYTAISRLTIVVIVIVLADAPSMRFTSASITG